MSTAEKLTEHYLTCIICSEVFTNPATLQCDHSFCRPCLVSYTRTQHEAIQAKSIPCPVCRQMTKVASPKKTVDEWVEELKPSRIIQGLIDDFGQNPKGGDTLKKPQAFLCKTHKDEQVKLFCKDCKKAICHICCGIDHRNCKTIVSIKETLPEIASSILTAKSRLNEKINRRNEIIAKRISKMKAIQTEATRVTADIKKASRIAIDVIRAKEEQLMEKLHKINSKQIQQLKDELNSDEMAIHVHQQQMHFIEKAVEFDSQEDMFDMYEKCQMESTDDVIDVSLPDKIMFRWDSDSLSSALDEVQMGQIYSTKVGDIGRETSPVLQQTIDTKILKYKSKPEITGIVVMEVDDVKLLVVVDRKNNSLQAFKTDENPQCVDLLRLDREPFGITAINTSEVLVTTPYDDALQKISVFPKLAHISTYETGRLQFGIYCSDNNTLYASRDPVFGKPTVDISNMEGGILKTIELNSTSIPRYISGTNQGTILVSDRNMNIMFISPEDTVPFKSIDTQKIGVNKPRGIISTVSGDILLVAMDANKVLQLTESGAFVRDILTSADGLDKPRAIFTDKDGLLYVTSGQYVKVFMFQ